MVNKKMAIIGWGSQAKAWALNLRDSGWDITTLLRPQSQSKKMARELGFQSMDLGDSVEEFDSFALLTPDHTHLEILEELAPRLDGLTKIILAHGYSYDQYHFDQKFPHLNFSLLAPKAIASEVRFQYQTKGKLGACYWASKQDERYILKLASDLGITAGPFPAHFKDEAFADLFSEQSLLCGLLPYAAKKSFELLRKKGIPAELAFMECWLEVKLIADAMVKKGPIEFFELISPNALIGAEKAQKLLIDENYQSKIEKIWNDIESGQFYNQLQEENPKEVRSRVFDKWKNSEISSLYTKLKKDLIPQ